MNKYQSFIFKLLNKIFSINNKFYSYIKEDINSLLLSKNKSLILYLDGYWQNYNNFDYNMDKLIQDLKFKNEKNYFKSFKNKILEEENSIALHIRRTDYLNPINIKTFKILDKDYYEEGLMILTNKLIKPIIYVFTDEKDNDIIEFLKNKNYNFYLISDYKFNDLEEFDLMRTCHSFITANSTYSWSAAWLAFFQNNHISTVIIPKFWYIDIKKNIDYTKNITHNSWYVI